MQMDKFKGQVLLVVNLASACGFTPQYNELQVSWARAVLEKLEMDFMEKRIPLSSPYLLC